MVENYSNVLPLEQMEIGEDFSLTINLAGNPSGYNADRQRYIDFLDTYFDGSYYTLRPEYSPRGRLHYHGTIAFNSRAEIARFYSRLHHMRKKCQLEIDSIKEPEKWAFYCKKQRDFLKSYSFSKKLKYKINNEIVTQECTTTRLATFGDFTDGDILDD